MLQYQRALHIAIAVEPGRKNEVPFEKSGVLAEDIEDFVFGHDFRVGDASDKLAFSISAAMASAAVAGSAAPVMGLPITR